MTTMNTELMQGGKIDEIDRITDGKWVAEVGVDSFMKPHPEDKRIPRNELPLTVPVQWWSQVLGVNPSEVSMTLIRQRSTAPKDYGYVSNEQTWQLVADKPFACVHFREHDEWHGDIAKLMRGMTLARQMHKGELGQKPELIWKPQILPSGIEDPDNGHWDNSDPNDPKYIRPNLNWVELNELGQIVGLNAEEIIRGFAGFSTSTWYEPNVPLLRGMLRREDIIRVYVGEVPKSFCCGEYYWGDNTAVSLDSLSQLVEANQGKVWVPQSFAYTVIRLMQFGYRPENETPENSFRLEAPMPTAPESKLPVLSVEELRELHALRQNLPKELPKVAFRRIAEVTLDNDNWQKTPVMDDDKGGVGQHYNDFNRLDLDCEGGYIMISTAFWSRAGAHKSDNYYSGMLAAFPRRVADPRRDPSAILRIWFWPGELVRQTPSGSKGGLCPPEVPTDLAERVKRLLGGLGYTI